MSSKARWALPGPEVSLLPTLSSPLVMPWHPDCDPSEVPEALRQDSVSKYPFSDPIFLPWFLSPACWCLLLTQGPLCSSLAPPSSCLPPLLLRSPHTCSSVLLPSQTISSFPPQEHFSLTSVSLASSLPTLSCPHLFPPPSEPGTLCPSPPTHPLGFRLQPTQLLLVLYPAQAMVDQPSQCLCPSFCLRHPSTTTTLALTSLPS